MRSQRSKANRNRNYRGGSNCQYGVPYLAGRRWASRFVNRDFGCRLPVALQPLQVSANFGGTLVSKFSVFFQRLVDDSF